MRNCYNEIVRIRGKKAFYFDENGVYRCIPKDELRNYNFPNIHYRADGSMYWIKVWIGENKTIFRKAICQMLPGETYEDFLKKLDETELIRHQELSIPEIDRFIIRIEKPVFYRSNSNQKESTFDYIYVEVLLNNNWEEDIQIYLKKNLDEIKKRVAEKIEKSSKLKKYGVPINFLRISRITLDPKKAILQVVFELKELKK